MEHNDILNHQDFSLILLKPGAVVAQYVLPAVKESYPQLRLNEQRDIAFRIMNDIRKTTKQNLVELLKKSDEYDERFGIK